MTTETDTININFAQYAWAISWLPFFKFYQRKNIPHFRS